jgi:hypothetical protein
MGEIGDALVLDDIKHKLNPLVGVYSKIKGQKL